MADYNSMSFTPREAELANQLIQYLLTYNKKSQEHYCDIHITTDGYCTTIEWESVPYNHEWGGKFVHINEDEDIYKEVHDEKTNATYWIPRWKTKEEFLEELAEDKPDDSEDNLDNDKE